MSNINFNELLQKSQTWVKGNRKTVISGLAAVFLLGVGIWFYIDYTDGKEQEASIAINNLVNQIKQIEYSQDALGAADTLRSLRDQMAGIYNQNKGLINGRRALFLAGNIDFRLSDFAAAKTRFLEVAKKKSHYLAPASLYHAAVCAEEEGKFDEAASLLQDFDARYFSSELYPDSRIALARVQSLKGDSSKAQKTLEDLGKLENGKYKAIAQKELDLMRLRGQMSAPQGAPINR